MLIREVPGQRRVIRGPVNGEDCVTRTLLSVRLSPTLGALVEKIVLHGHGSMQGIIPEELQLTLEGYRVAARLPRDVHPAPWSHAVAAGVDGDGHVTVSTAWIEGTPLHHVEPAPPEVAGERALDALRILVLLHERLVSYGDFKSENLVLRPDGSVALIDLDTLREVAAADAWAPTRDLTRSWAAPEQTIEQRTYLASDLWAWAQFVAFLFPAGPPPAWTIGLAACRNRDPLRRPRTESLLSWLELGLPLVDWRDRPVVAGPSEPSTQAGATATERVAEAPPSTERVPDSGPTERVPENTAPGPRPTPVNVELAPTAKRKGGGFGCLYAAIGLVVAPFALCSGAWFWYERTQVEEANRLADELLTDMKANKTRIELNRDPTQRAELQRRADEGWETSNTPRAGAARALATIWGQGWQDSGRSWSDEKYTQGLAVIDAAPNQKMPEVLLARATLEAAACRLDAKDTSVAARCKRALDNAAAAITALPAASEHHWLRVEAAWTEVLVRAELAEQARASGNPEAATQRAAGIARCTEAEAWVEYAPVNGPELFQDCLRLAGSADDVPNYLRWGSLLVKSDLLDGTLSKLTLGHLYGGAPGCQSVGVDKRRSDWRVTGPSWCVALGHAARGCHDLARAATIQGLVDDPNRPWSALEAAIAAPATCAR
jgi:hypothetical protein